MIYVFMIYAIIIKFFCRFRLAMEINCNASLFISYNSCKLDRH